MDEHDWALLECVTSRLDAIVKVLGEIRDRLPLATPLTVAELRALDAELDENIRRDFGPPLAESRICAAEGCHNRAMLHSVRCEIHHG